MGIRFFRPIFAVRLHRSTRISRFHRSPRSKDEKPPEPRRSSRHAPIAFEVDQSRSGHGARNDLIGKRKRQVVACGAHPCERCAELRQNSSFAERCSGAPAECAARSGNAAGPGNGQFGYVHCLATGNIFQEHDDICHAALRANAKSFQVANSGFLRIADAIVFINGKGRRTRHRT